MVLNQSTKGTEEDFYIEGGETVAQVARKVRNIQGQVGQGCEQTDLVENVPTHCKGGWIGLDEL